MAGGIDTLEDCVDVETPGGARTRRRRRLLSGAYVGALVLLLGASLGGAYGVASRTVSARGGGYELEVRYGATSRPALATPFDLVVRRPGGFDGPVELAVTARYLAMWDENGLLPEPTATTSSGPWLVLEFDPPDGEVLRVAYDGRIEPAAQDGEDGRVAVLEDGRPVVEVAFSTRVLP